MQQEVNDTYNPFSGIDEDELRLLCFLAYFGGDEDEKNAASYRKKYHLNKKRYDELTYKLVSNHYVQIKTHVMEAWHLEVDSFLKQYRPKWLNDFMGMTSCHRTILADYLWQLSDCLDANEIEKATQIKRPCNTFQDSTINLSPYIEHQISHSDKYLQLITPEDVTVLTEKQLQDSFDKGGLQPVILAMMFDKAYAQSRRNGSLCDCIAFYRYLLDGTPVVPVNSLSSWGLIYEAFTRMYSQKFDLAFESFQLALSAISPRASFKCFDSPLVNFFYAICLLKLKTDKDPKQLRALKDFSESTNIKYKHEEFPARMLLSYLDAKEDEAKSYLGGRVRSVLAIDPSHMTKVFASLLFNHFGIEPDKNDGLEDIMPKAAIFRHELSPYVSFGRVEKEHLSNVYGGGPLLNSMKKLTKWESILKAVNSKASEQVSTGERRIVYYMLGRYVTTIMEQEKHADGNWYDSSLVSLKMLQSGMIESMNDTDSRIAMMLASKTETDADVLVSCLADTDRLLIGSPYSKDKHPAVINRAQPYIDIHGQGSDITITSNVQFDNKGFIKKHTVIPRQDNTFELVTVNAIQRDILQRILQQKVFPASAAVGLREMTDNIKGIVDIRHNILDKVLTPTITGNGMLSIRLIPSKNEYQFTILAAPIEKSDQRFSPGDGSDIVYEDVDGQTVCVRRDLDHEQENFEFAEDFLKNTIKAEFTKFNEGVIYTPEGLLKLLTMAYDNRDCLFLEWPEGQRLKFRGDVKGTDVSVSVKTDMNWFEVEGEVKIGGKKHTLQELLEMYRRSEYDGFIKIDDDEYARMTDTIRKHIEALEQMPTVGRGGCKVPLYQVGPLATAMEGQRQHTDGAYKDFLYKMKQAYSLDPELPDGVNATLRPYQLDGYKWMKKMDAWGAGCCLADDMGLGKTLQTLTFLQSKANEGPSLVVAPKSVLPNWIVEAERFVPSLNICNLNNATNRMKCIASAKAGDVVLCTYGVLTTMGDALSSKEWNVACLDEAHQIKNRETKVSQSAMALKAHSRIILTGTPLQNHLGELWNLFQFINPGLLGTWSLFRDRFILPELDEEHRDLLKELTSPFILRRTKEEVLHDLPEKMQHVRYVEMTAHEAEVYENMRQLVELKFKKGKTKAERDEVKEISINFFSELTKLRLAACSMRLVHDDWGEESSKIVALRELLEVIMQDPENRVIIFSQFTSFLEIVKLHLKRDNIEFFSIDGSTSMDKRQEQVTRFQLGERPIFLSSLKAGGLGINLTTANYVILLDPWWNPAIENQAMDRAHRLGQQRCVSVIRMITEHTIEEKILRLHKVKEDLSDDILDGTSETYKLTYEDIMDMVSPF